MNHSKICSNCDYFSSLSSYGGLCLRYAPRPVVQTQESDSLQTSWPTVGSSNTCGEWKEMQPEEP